MFVYILLIITSLAFSYILITCFSSKFFAYVNLINQIELPGNVINEYRVNIYIFSSTGGDSAVDHRKGLGVFLRPLLARLRQNLSWVLWYTLQGFNWLKNEAIGDVLVAQKRPQISLKINMWKQFLPMYILVPYNMISKPIIQYA